MYELAESILNKIPEKLDLEKAVPVLFEVSVVALHVGMLHKYVCTSVTPAMLISHLSLVSLKWGLIVIHLQTDEKGQINSLSTVLSQEVDRFNNLLRVLKVRHTPCISVQASYMLYS